MTLLALSFSFADPGVVLRNDPFVLGRGTIVLWRRSGELESVPDQGGGVEEVCT